MLNHRRSSSASLDMVTTPLIFFVNLSACVMIEASFLASQIFIHWALGRITCVIDPSGIDKISLLASEGVLDASTLVIICYFAFAHARKVIEQLSPTAKPGSNAKLEVTDPVSARDDLASNRFESTINANPGAKALGCKAALGSERRPLVSVRRQPEFFKPYRPWIGKDGPIGKRELAARVFIEGASVG